MPEDILHFPVTSIAMKMAVSIGIGMLIGLEREWSSNVRSILTDRSLEITTSAALMLNFLLGVLAGLGHFFTPVAAAMITTMLLARKTELNRFAGGLQPSEVRSAILLGLIGFVIYPILLNSRTSGSSGTEWPGGWFCNGSRS